MPSLKHNAKEHIEVEPSKGLTDILFIFGKNRLKFSELFKALKNFIIIIHTYIVSFSQKMCCLALFSELNGESENLTLRLCLRYITHPFCISEFAWRILKHSLA